MPKIADCYGFYCEECRKLQPFGIVESDFLLSLLECGVCGSQKIVETSRLNVVDTEEMQFPDDYRRDTEAER